MTTFAEHCNLHTEPWRSCGGCFDVTRAERDALRAELARVQDAAEHTQWAVAYGGEDGNDCAGLLGYDDEAEAREMIQWIDGGILVRRSVLEMRWENTQ